MNGDGQIPTGAGTLDPLNQAALDGLATASNEQLTKTRSHAEKWLGGITALAGLVGTAIVLKGPATIEDFGTLEKLGLAGAVAVAALFVGNGIFLANRAAWGEPGDPPVVETQPLGTLATRLDEARSIEVKATRAALKKAIDFTAAGVALALIAVLASWFIEPEKDESAKTTCVLDADNNVVLKVAGGQLAVQELRDLDVAPCPAGNSDDESG